MSDPGMTLQAPVAGATTEWCSEFKYLAEIARRTSFQHPWGQIGLIGVVIFVPAVTPGAEKLLRKTLDELVERAQPRVAASPPPESPAAMLELMRSLAG